MPTSWQTISLWRQRAAYEFGQPGNSRNAAAIWPLTRVQIGSVTAQPHESPPCSRITRSASRTNSSVTFCSRIQATYSLTPAGYLCECTTASLTVPTTYSTCSSLITP